MNGRLAPPSRRLDAWSGSAVAPPLVPSDRRWDALLVCVAAYVLIAVGRVHQLFGFLEPLRLGLASAALAIGLYLLGHGESRRLSLVLRSPITRCVLGLGVWMGFSVPWALWQGGAFETFTEFAKIVLMFVILAGVPRSVRDVERLTFVYLLSVAVYAAVILTRFDVGERQWRLGVLYYYDANEFATLAVMAVPLGVYFMVRPRPWWRRLASALALAVLAVGIIWAGSRGGFLALLAVGAFLLMRYTAIHVRWRVLTTALLAFVFAATASDTYWQKMKTIMQPKDDYNITGEQGRLKVWKRGLGYMIEHPVLGVGAGNFATAEGTISPLARAAPVGRGVKWSVAHNSFLQVGAELGVPGLVLFVLMLGGAFRTLRAVQRTRIPVSLGERSPPAAPLAQAIAAALIGYIVAGIFLSLAYRDLLFVLLGLVVALRKTTQLATASAAIAPRPLSWSS